MSIIFLLVVIIISLWAPPLFLLILGVPLVSVVTASFGASTVSIYVGADLLISDFIVVTLFLRTIFMSLHQQNLLQRMWYGLFPVLVFLVISLLSILFSYTKYGAEFLSNGATAYLRLVGFIIIPMILVFAHAQTEDQVKTAIRYLLLLGIIGAGFVYLTAVFRQFLGISFGESSNSADMFTRYQGFFGDSVKLLLLPFAFYYILIAKWKQALFFLIALLLTGGLLGLVGLWAGVTILSIKNLRRVAVRYVGAFIILILVFLAGFYFNFGGIQTRLLSIELLQATFIPRVASWQIAWSMTQDNPVLGVGFGNLGLAWWRYISVSRYDPFSGAGAFNQMLKILAETGILGLISFVWMLINILSISRKPIPFQENNRLWKIHLDINNVFILTLIVVSPLDDWFLPGSYVTYILFLYVAISQSIVSVYPANEYKLIFQNFRKTI